MLIDKAFENSKGIEVLNNFNAFAELFQQRYIALCLTKVIKCYRNIFNVSLKSFTEKFSFLFEIL